MWRYTWKAATQRSGLGGCFVRPRWAPSSPGVYSRPGVYMQSGMYAQRGVYMARAFSSGIMNTSSEVRGVYASTDAVSDAAAAVAATAAAAAAEAATSSAAAAAAARSSGLEPCLFYPSGEIEEVSIPERLRMISWLAHHTAIDLSCFTAHAKKYKGPPLKPQDPRPIDYSWVELRLNLSSPEATRLRDVFRQASVPSALRNGRLLEVLDCFAADVAFAYTRPSIVLTKDRHDLFLTVAIDSIRLFGCDPLSNHTSSSSSSSSSSIGVKETPEGASFPYISVDKDLILRGFVSYAGSSSVEITAELHQVRLCFLFVLYLLSSVGVYRQTAEKIMKYYSV